MTDVVTPTDSGVRIALRVIPRSPQPGIAGVREGRLLVRVTAPPVDSAANEALVELIARALGLPRRAVRIAGGHTSRNKTIEADGVRADDARQRLGNAGEARRPA